MTAAATKRQASAETDPSSTTWGTTWLLTVINNPSINSNLNAAVVGEYKLKFLSLSFLPLFISKWIDFGYIGIAYCPASRIPLPRITWGNIDGDPNDAWPEFFMFLNWGIYAFNRIIPFTDESSTVVVQGRFYPFPLRCILSFLQLSSARVETDADPDAWSATAQGTATGHPNADCFGKDLPEEKNARVPAPSHTTV